MYKIGKELKLINEKNLSNNWRTYMYWQIRNFDQTSKKNLIQK